jgi:hypothetical protein
MSSTDAGQSCLDCRSPLRLRMWRRSERRVVKEEVMAGGREER